MKRILVLLILTIPFFGFGQNDTLKNYHDNGQLRSIGVFKYGENEGLWKFFNKDGFLKQSINYKNGRYHGLWTNYRRNKKNLRISRFSINFFRNGNWFIIGNLISFSSKAIWIIHDYSKFALSSRI